MLLRYASSTAGHTGALMTMGYRHLYGYGVPRNCETAAMNYIEVLVYHHCSLSHIDRMPV